MNTEYPEGENWMDVLLTLKDCAGKNEENKDLIYKKFGQEKFQ